MKTLIINGSPRKNGDTMSLITKLKEHLSGEINQIDTYYSEIKPCIDCRYCWEYSSCAIKDEMQNIYKMIGETDNIIIASPIYFSELSGSLLQLASRLQYFWVSKNIRHESVLSDKKRKGIIILVGGGDGSPEQPLHMGKLLLHHMGAEYYDSVCSHNTNNTTSNNDIISLNRVQEIARKLDISK